ncbi:hypothetical protein TERTU_4528 [Teredinibacter turnerae T7901]|uniref:Uncharacterized protein n=1 Tax=Teredinibacter turnerae (strain ATCC 39867 / T7901) TaxID=377629 RepID=C5BJP3_TERTT|nr:hypothetical protein TERTU_4528 [Teredinibacter turnerae T7901]
MASSSGPHVAQLFSQQGTHQCLHSIGKISNLRQRALNTV